MADSDNDRERDPDESPVIPPDFTAMLAMTEHLHAMHLALVASGFSPVESVTFLGVWFANAAKG